MLLLNMFSLQEFLRIVLLIFLKKIVKSSTLFFAYKSVLSSQLTLVTKNSLANCHFSKKGHSPNNQKLQTRIRHLA